MPTLNGEFNPTVPTRVIFGQGRAETLGSEVAALGGRRALVLSGRTVAEQTDTVRQVHAALGDAAVGVYSGLTQRAPLATAVEAANLAVSLEADTLVGVGGSTISDAARMIAVLMAEGITTVDELRRQGHEQDGMMHPDLDGKALPLAGLHPNHAFCRRVQHGRRQCAGRRREPQNTGGPFEALC